MELTGPQDNRDGLRKTEKRKWRTPYEAATWAILNYRGTPPKEEVAEKDEGDDSWESKEEEEEVAGKNKKEKKKKKKRMILDKVRKKK